MTKKTLNFLPAKLTYLFWHARVTSVSSYYPVFLADIGLNPVQISIITALKLISICLGGIVWSSVADKTKRYVLLIFVLLLTAVITSLPQPFIAKYMTNDSVTRSNETLLHTKIGTNATQLSVVSVPPSTDLIYVLIVCNLGYFFVGGLAGIIDNTVVNYVRVKDSIRGYSTQRVFGTIGSASISVIIGLTIDGNYLSTISQYSVIFFYDFILSLCFLAVFYILIRQIDSKGNTNQHNVEYVNTEGNQTNTGSLYGYSIQTLDPPHILCNQHIVDSTMDDASKDVVETLNIESVNSIAPASISNVTTDVECAIFTVCKENIATSSKNNAGTSNKETENVGIYINTVRSTMVDNSIDLVETSNITSNASICLTLRQPKVYLFYIMLLLEGIAKGVIINTFLLHLRELNASSTFMGASLAVQYICTMIMYPFSSLLIIKCGGQLNTMCISSATFALRFLLWSYIKNIWLLLPLQCLQCVNGALFWVAVVEYTHGLSTTGTGNRMFGFVTVIYKDSSRALGFFLGGVMFEIYGGHKLYLYLCPVYTLVLLMNITIAIYLKKATASKSE